MADLAIGQTCEMKGSGSKPYIIKNCGPGGYSCTCPAWRNQNIDPASRTCKHIVRLRGEEAEKLRVGSAQDLPSRKPEDAVETQVLLAESWDGETDVGGWWMSEKLDGVRAYWDGKRFLSRKGNLFLAPDFFVANLPAVPLDGELWVGRKKFTQAQGTAMSQAGGEAWRQMKFVVFDVPAHGGEFKARLRFLTDLVKRASSPFLTPHEQTQCRDVDHLREYLDQVESLGGEGLMLRQPGSKYEAGRSGTLLKVKTFHTAEATVIGHEPGQGKHKGRLGAVAARLADGTVFRIGTGFSDAQRHNPPPIGSVVMFKYQELTDLGVPRFPAYVGPRTDAKPAPLVKTPAAVVKPPVVAVAVPAAPPAAEKPGLVRRCHYINGPTTFWEASCAGATVRQTFGTVGGKQSSKQAEYASAEAARAALEEMLADRLEDGFAEVDPVTHRAVGAEAEVLEELGEPEPEPVPKPAKAAKSAAPAKAAAPAKSAAPAAAPGGRRFEFSDGKSNKFWRVELSGKSFTVTFGKIGTSGQVQTKDFASEAAAKKEHDKLIGEKLRKGYREVS